MKSDQASLLFHDIEEPLGNTLHSAFSGYLIGLVVLLVTVGVVVVLWYLRYRRRSCLTGLLLRASAEPLQARHYLSSFKAMLLSDKRYAHLLGEPELKTLLNKLLFSGQAIEPETLRRFADSMQRRMGQV